MKAGIKELQVLTKLFDKYRVWYHQQTDLEAATKFLEERIKNDESIIFLALAEGFPAGFTQLYPIFSSVRMRKAYLLNDLYVEVFARKQGVAASLLDTAKQYARQQDAAFLILQTGHVNTQAQTLYERTGWKKVDDYIYEFDL